MLWNSGSSSVSNKNLYSLVDQRAGDFSGGVEKPRVDRTREYPGGT